MAQPPRSRRAFLGAAAAVAAAPVAIAVTGRPGRSAAAGAAAEPGGSAAASPAADPGSLLEPGRLPGPPARRRKLAENSLPGDPRWDIRHLGARAAIMGYSARASVLAGEYVPLFVSTTSRWFRVRAFRMGWYRGD